MSARAGVRPEVFVMQGGLDLVSPALSLSAGKLIDSLNFEPDLVGGYRRMYGHERFDGRPSPSAQNYWNQAITLTGSIAAGNTVTGATSGATAVVLKVNGTTELIVTKLVGTFAAETLNVGGVGQATVTTTFKNSAITPILHATYKGLVADNYRTDILKVPGSGAVLGNWYFNGVLYAFRNNAGGTAAVMYKSTSTGWSAVTMGRQISFTGAVGQINDGDTITGGTSGATGVVGRALLRTGTWTVSGVGSLQLDSVTGAFQNGEALKVGGSTKVTSSSLDTAITLSPGGRYEFATYNFSGGASTIRMYGCDGVNNAFEFDGTRYVPIVTGLHTDTPSYIAVWKNMLVLAYGTNVEVSGVGLPYSWTALTGASVIALGDNCSGLLPQLGDASSGALAIFTSGLAGLPGKTFILYGNSSADFKLVIQSPDAGAQPYTAQNIGFAYYLDTKGVVQINSTRNYGNFEISTLTRAIQPLIDSKRGLAKASCVVRATNQYRIFYSDGTGIIVYLQSSISQYTNTPITQVGALMFFDFQMTGPVYFNTVSSAVDSTGVERIFASGSDGYVYELERGTSWDGANIQSHLFTAFNPSKSPRNRKHYHRTVLQATCQNTAAITVGYTLNYGSLDTQEGARTAQSIIGGGSWWDVFIWDNFNWDTPFVTDYEIDTPGNGVNMGLIIYGNTNIDQPYTVHSGILHYSINRLER